jgi:hypothetical protein
MQRRKRGLPGKVEMGLAVEAHIQNNTQNHSLNRETDFKEMIGNFSFDDGRITTTIITPNME